MSQFSGKQQRGAMKARREAKREQADERNARTPLRRRRAYREGTAEQRLLLDVFADVDAASSVVSS